MEGIKDSDYNHAERACKDFEIKNSSAYHDLHLKSDTLLLVDIFEDFTKIYFEIYELDPAKCPSDPD